MSNDPKGPVRDSDVKITITKGDDEPVTVRVEHFAAGVPIPPPPPDFVPDPERVDLLARAERAGIIVEPEAHVGGGFRWRFKAGAKPRSYLLTEGYAETLGRLRDLVLTVEERNADPYDGKRDATSRCLKAQARAERFGIEVSRLSPRTYRVTFYRTIPTNLAGRAWHASSVKELEDLVSVISGWLEAVETRDAAALGLSLDWQREAKAWRIARGERVLYLAPTLPGVRRILAAFEGDAKG